MNYKTQAEEYHTGKYKQETTIQILDKLITSGFYVSVRQQLPFPKKEISQLIQNQISRKKIPLDSLISYNFEGRVHYDRTDLPEHLQLTDFQILFDAKFIPRSELVKLDFEYTQATHPTIIEGLQKMNTYQSPAPPFVMIEPLQKVKFSVQKYKIAINNIAVHLSKRFRFGNNPYEQYGQPRTPIRQRHLQRSAQELHQTMKELELIDRAVELDMIIREFFRK